MEKRADSLARLDRRTSNIPLVVVSVCLLGLMIAGVVVSLRAGSYVSAAIFAGTAALFVVVALLDMAQTRRLAAIDDRRFIQWDAALPEIQRQNVNLEVRELIRLLGAGEEQMGDLLSAYVVAEDLALRQIQQEENLPLMRHVAIGGTSFDGILVDQDLITCIEVSFVVVPDVRQEKIEAMLRKISVAKKNLAAMKSRLRLRLMVVLVTQLASEDVEKLRDMLGTGRFTDTPVDIDIRLIDFEMLQKVYVNE